MNSILNKEIDLWIDEENTASLMLQLVVILVFVGDEHVHKACLLRASVFSLLKTQAANCLLTAQSCQRIHSR